MTPEELANWLSYHPYNIKPEVVEQLLANGIDGPAFLSFTAEVLVILPFGFKFGTVIKLLRIAKEIKESLIAEQTEAARQLKQTLMEAEIREICNCCVDWLSTKQIYTDGYGDHLIMCSTEYPRMNSLNAGYCRFAVGMLYSSLQNIPRFQLTGMDILHMSIMYDDGTIVNLRGCDTSHNATHTVLYMNGLLIDGNTQTKVTVVVDPTYAPDYPGPFLLETYVKQLVKLYDVFPQSAQIYCKTEGKNQKVEQWWIDYISQ